MAYAVGLARVTQPTYRNGRLALLLGTVEEKIPGRWIAGGGGGGQRAASRKRGCGTALARWVSAISMSEN